MFSPRTILFYQTIYYSLTAVWPLVHIDSFMQVTGPKTDVWLVKTVAILLVAISISFIIALVQKEVKGPVIALAVSSAVLLTVIDIYYSFNDTISDIYLGDAIAEMLLIVWWIITLYRMKNHHPN